MLILLLALIMPSTYYIDPESGNDRSNGTSPSAAWRSLEHASTVAFQPGDSLALKGGSILSGSLKLVGVKGLTIQSFGRGIATIQGGAYDGVFVKNSESIKIENLHIRGAGRKANDGSGIRLLNVRSAVLERIDVRGFRIAGIRVDAGRDILISQSVANENGAAGIEVSGEYDGLHRSQRITIRDCKTISNAGDPKNLTNHSGSGIVVGAVDGCLIEYCEAAENGYDMPREGNGPVGIWAWNASKVIIQYSISHNNKSPGLDGGGFDFDGGVTDSIIQNCLSYNNVGTGYLICQYSQGGLWKNNIIQNNISYEDGFKNSQSGIALYTPPEMKNISDALIENNTIVNSGYGVTTMHELPGMVFRNNVFVTKKELFKLYWGEGGFKGSLFENNIAWGLTGEVPPIGDPKTFQDPDSWTAKNRTVDPQLLMPQSWKDLPTNPRLLNGLLWFKPSDKSPCRKDGKIVVGADMAKLPN